MFGLGFRLAFVVDGISFFVSAACLAPLLASSAPPSRPADSQANSVLRDMREGIGHPRSVRALDDRRLDLAQQEL